MRTSNRPRKQLPFDDERPTQPIGHDDSLGTALSGEQPDIPQPFWERADAESSNGQTALSDDQTAVGISSPSRRRGGPRVSRRTLLVSASVAGVAAVALAAGIGTHSLTSSSPANPASPVGSNSQIAHLLRRAGFGAAPGEVETYKALGIEGAVDRLLNFQNIPNTLMDQRIAAGRKDDALLAWPAHQQLS